MDHNVRFRNVSLFYIYKRMCLDAVKTCANVSRSYCTWYKTLDNYTLQQWREMVAYWARSQFALLVAFHGEGRRNVATASS